MGNVTQLATGSNHACALDEQGVTCWGTTQWPVTEVPETLTNPTLITAYDLTTCAIDEPEGEAAHIECWGSVAGPINSFMPKTISNVKSLSLGRNFICLLDDNGPNCWGYDYYGVTDIPDDLVSPVKLSAGYGHVCVLDETPQGNVVRCWGDGSNGELDVPVDLNNPVDVVSGSFRSCALQGDGVRCWGQNHLGQSEDQILDQPYSLKLGYAHACVMSASNLHCWGDLPSGRPSDLSFIDFDNDGTPNEEDAFNTNPKASVDADNDGLPDDCIDEECGGLTQDPSLNDTDNDGLVNELDDVVGDNNPPVVLTIPLYGQMRAVGGANSTVSIQPPFQLLSAEDFVSEQLTWQVSVDNADPVPAKFGFFTSLTIGNHTLAWQAIDEAGNVSEPKVQVVNVFPAVTFSAGESSMTEGDTLTIEVSLAGESPIYPVAFKVAVDFDQSSADADDIAGDYWTSESQLIEIPESGKTNLIVKTVNNNDTAETEQLKLELTYAEVTLLDGTVFELNRISPTQHTVTIESVEDDVDPGDGNGGCDCPDNGGDNNSGGDDNSGGNDNSDGDDNTSGAKNRPKSRSEDNKLLVSNE